MMYRIYLYKFLIDFWVIVPVIVPFYRSHGMSATQILIIQAAYSLSQLVFEIPSGYFSDAIGRRKTLILAAFLMLSGIALYAWSEGFWWFVSAEVILGSAGAMRSGTDSALLYDHLKSIRDEHRYKKCEGHAEFWSRTGTAVSAVAGGALGAFATLRLPFYVNMGSAFLMLLVGFSLKEPFRAELPKGNPLRNILKTAWVSVRNPRLLSPMIRMGIIGSTGVTAIWGYFMLYRHYNLPLVWHGIIFAAMQFTSAFGARHGAQFEGYLGYRISSLMILVPGLLFVVIGLIHHAAVLLPLVMLHALLWGMSTPLLLEEIQHRTTSDVRATTLSVSSMIGRIITICIGPAFGWIVDHRATGVAYISMGCFFYTVIILAWFVTRSGMRSNRP